MADKLEDVNSPTCYKCFRVNSITEPDAERDDVWWSYCQGCNEWTEHASRRIESRQQPCVQGEQR